MAERHTALEYQAFRIARVADTLGCIDIAYGAMVRCYAPPSTDTAHTCAIWYRSLISAAGQYTMSAPDIA
eukprot:789138-Rhodomonas_salina.3